MKIEDIKKNFISELNLVDKFILNELKSDIPIINNIGEYLLLYGGKRIRPLMTILFSKIFSADYEKSISMAAAIELIHAATLLHDDVVDVSEKRRGKFTVNKLWGNKEAILIGDFLYTRSFQIMVNIDNSSILRIMSDTTNIMSEGEVFQLINRGNFDITENDCLEIIKCKTAQLFSAATVIPAILNTSDNNCINAAKNYGLFLGMVYQLIDDVLDYSTDDERFGKNIAIDIKNATFTLPLVYFINKDLETKIKIKNILTKSINFNDINEVKDLVLKSDSLERTMNLAFYYANLAKDAMMSIPSSRYTHLALELIDFILHRKY